MPTCEAPCVELGSAPATPSAAPSPSPSSERSSASSPDRQNVRPTPLFRALAMPPPEPIQPPGQEELERRLPGYRRIVIPRELTLIELLKQYSGVTTDDEVLHIREAKLQVVAERVGLRRLHVLAPCLRTLILDGSAISSLRDLGIGLVHLKILSVNRCGLTSLDGIWGLSSLRELYAAHNRLQDIQLLAALQKLHTLDMSHNPISDSSRLWMLAVCGSLRKLTLIGTPASNEMNYRANVASALPLLISLDGSPLHNDVEDEDIVEDPGSSSESEAEDNRPSSQEQEQKKDTEPIPSTSKKDQGNGKGDGENKEDLDARMVKAPPQLKVHQGRRPATTENAGVRPKHQLKPRPKTAHDRPTIDACTRLEILNTLMDEEWRCSGSKLTSHGAVCGNLAQALRRPLTARRARERAAACEEEKYFGADLVSRDIAVKEIPRSVGASDWERFKKETGIDIDIDFSIRPSPGDAAAAIERLERIEKETAERMANPGAFSQDFDIKDRLNFTPVHYEIWKMENPLLLDSAMDNLYRPGVLEDVGDIFANTTDLIRTPESMPD